MKKNSIQSQEEKILKKRIVRVLKEQGFSVNPHLRPIEPTKQVYRKIQERSRLEQLSFHKNFLRNFTGTAKMFCRDGCDINPEEIALELREVKSKSLEEDIFRWWNFIWWSIPYQHPYGRQMRFVLWDTHHDLPFGLINLQSPILKMSVRDKRLGIPNNELDFWVNKSMSAQRVGALPPFNELIGGKMVALALTSNEIREKYRQKYKGYVSVLRKKKIRPELLFITTTSAFGKSSMYDRLKYNGEVAAELLGNTQGSGSFHIPEKYYEEMLQLLKRKGVKVGRGFGNGPSRKLKLISNGFRLLGLGDSFSYHGIQREFYLFSLVNNLQEVIKHEQPPKWIDRPLSRIVDYWKERWAIPRSRNIQTWKRFKASRFFDEVERELMSV
jgi:hypothetical protein